MDKKLLGKRFFFFSLQSLLFHVCSVKLNGGRKVSGVLRGYDPFMNIVLDDALEEVSKDEKHNIGMIV